MKYLFSVDNLNTDETKLYSIEAENKEAAKSIISKKFLPLVPEVSFDALADCLANGMDIVLSYIGPVSQIEEI